MTTPQRRGQNLWIDCESGFIGAAWYWPTQATAESTAVVIVPGIVHEERTMASGLVALAEALADTGLPALLMDLHGCSQSAGQLEDDDIGTCWRASIRAAVRHARSSGVARLIVVGVRLGFPLAVDALADEPLAALIAWAPIVSGKRYVRELKLLQRTKDVEAAAVGTIAIGGFSIHASVLECISTLDLTEIEPPNAAFVMMREMPEGLNAPWLARLGQHGVTVQEQVSTQTHPWLFSATDEPELPREDIEALARWCRALHDEQHTSDEPAPIRPAPRPAVEFVHHGRRVRETFIEIGPTSLTGVLSEPLDLASDNAVRLLMSTIGPGRTFTDFARDEASRGNTSLRFDFAGFGTSGRGDAAQGGELYTDQGARDVQAAIQHLRQMGYERIYGLGFCAGAWSMMQAEVAPELQAVVAINVALYRQPGIAGPKVATRTRRRLARIAPALVRNLLLHRIAGHVRRTASKRREPVEWLTRLCNSDVRVLLAYSELDPGLDYLNAQIAQGVEEQVRRPFTLQTYAGLGHLAEGPSARTRMFRDITDFFADLDRE
jgi:dienelactone hydrolase